jgi:hypothetical protein
MKAIISCIVISVALLCNAAARKQSTTHSGRLVPTVETVATPPGGYTADTLAGYADSIVISGYDKPVTASHETFLVTNNGSRTITTLTVTFTYTDKQQRQLHKATHTIECEIPPHQTRMAAVATWDKQRSFYYYLSVHPRRQATPYMVTHRVECVVADAY